jgi:predicted transcriptional regulator
MTDLPKDDLTIAELTTEIISAYVGHNAVSIDSLPGLIRNVHSALSGLGTPAPEPVVERKPAVPVNKSVQADFIICLEDGAKFKSLKRHLRTHYNLSPEEYREKWGLKPDYPMVAPAYAAIRSQLAKANGLGRKPVSVN